MAAKSVSQATLLVDLVLQNAILFHNPDSTPYVAMPVKGHQEVYPLRSRTMREWVGRQYWQAQGSVPGSQALQDALNVLVVAGFESPEYPVYTRLGGQQDRLYLDLANDEWQAIEMDAHGWRLVDRPPIMFRRPNTLGKLPVPVAGGQLNDLLQSIQTGSPSLGFVVSQEHDLPHTKPDLTRNQGEEATLNISRSVVIITLNLNMLTAFLPAVSLRQFLNLNTINSPTTSACHACP